MTVRPPMRKARLILALFVSHSLAPTTHPDPFSNVPADRREALSERITAYVETYRARNWEKLYGFVSDVGKGEASQKVFIAAMQASHGRDFAQDPDLQEFKPDRTKTNADGYDIYGCGRAEREGHTYKGIAVVHGIFERDNWYFTGWSFTEFPNEPCKALSDPKWEPENEMGWNTPMEELANFKQKGVPMHVDTPK